MNDKIKTKPGSTFRMGEAYMVLAEGDDAKLPAILKRKWKTLYLTQEKNWVGYKVRRSLKKKLNLS